MVLILILQKVRAMSCVLSVNQFANYTRATEKGKHKIVAQQLNPNKLLIPWYQLSKARIKKSLESKDLEPIHSGIIELMNRVPANQRQEIDKRTSIDALQRFVQMNILKVFSKYDYSVIKPDYKSVLISSIEVIVAPDIIIQTIVDGKVSYGAVKIHICKSKPFDLKRAEIVSTIIYKYLRNSVAQQDEVVLPEFCFCLDIFGGRIVSAPSNINAISDEITETCKDIQRVYSSLI